MEEINNCIDLPCKHINGEFCMKLNHIVPDDVDIVNCEHFELATTCLDCAYAVTQVYETGTIDDIEYRCPFQNNKMIYDDMDCYNSHYHNIPECNCGRFKCLI